MKNFRIVGLVFWAGLGALALAGCEEATDTPTEVNTSSADATDGADGSSAADGATADGTDGADGSSADGADGTDTADGTDGTDGVDGADSTDGTVEPSVGVCNYTNPFSQGLECKEYSGDGWTADSAEADCAAVFLGTAGTFTADSNCAYESELGRCTIGDASADGYLLVNEGTSADDCALAQAGCEGFGGGTFVGSELCGGAADGTDGTDGVDGMDGTDMVDGIDGGFPGVFVAGFTECLEPVDGDPAGAGPDGTVCTQNMIGGCSEPGYKFIDYASCDVVYTQRPYYPYPAPEAGPEDDPRLQDSEYMGELEWVTEQVEACGCVCCHSKNIAPEGPSAWYTDAGPLWVDTVTDEGVAFFTGLADSASLGAYPAEENNGFDRLTTGLPTTDIPRMQAFWLMELERRELTEEWAAAVPPFGDFLIDQVEYKPEACATGIGVDADGNVQWGSGQMRYVYVLEAGSKMPGVPPNLDVPEGTLWMVEVTHMDPPFGDGFKYGEAPPNGSQRIPASGSAPTLESGKSYVLVTLLDVAVPITRCLFTAP